MDFKLSKKFTRLHSLSYPTIRPNLNSWRLPVTARAWLWRSLAQFNPSILYTCNLGIIYAYVQFIMIKPDFKSFLLYKCMLKYEISNTVFISYEYG